MKTFTIYRKKFSDCPMERKPMKNMAREAGFGKNVFTTH